MNDILVIAIFIILVGMILCVAYGTAKGMEEILAILGIHRERLNDLEEKETK